MRKCLTLLLAAFTVLYPVVVYVGMGSLGLNGLLGLLLGAALLRAAVSRERFWWGVALAVSVLCALGLLLQDARAVKLYPVLVSTAMLGVFAWSLRHPPTVVERLARLQTPDLPPQAIRYTTRVTQVWCVFFLLNGTVSLITVYWASDRIWALYNGLISYGLMGVLMVGEWVVRSRVKARLQMPRQNGAAG